MRVVVYGGRDFNDEGRVFRVLDRLDAEYGIDVVIHGKAPGADSLGAKWGQLRRKLVEPYPAAWYDLSHPDAVIRINRRGRKYDALAGHRRNQQMIDYGRPDIGVEFPGGPGTANMRSRLKHAGIEVVPG